MQTLSSAIFGSYTKGRKSVNLFLCSLSFLVVVMSSNKKAQRRGQRDEEQKQRMLINVPSGVSL